MEWVDLKDIYIIIHIFGAIIGAGGAYMSDAMFFSSIKDRVISGRELQFMKIGSTFVWIGLFISIISGLFIFSTDPAGYLESSKFLIKNFIVLIIILNGIYFHWQHIPLLHKNKDIHYDSSEEFVKKKKHLMISGVISITSWTFVVILGSLRMIPIDFWTALYAYIIFEIIAIMLMLIFVKFKRII